MGHLSTDLSSIEMMLSGTGVLGLNNLIQIAPIFLFLSFKPNVVAQLELCYVFCFAGLLQEVQK